MGSEEKNYEYVLPIGTILISGKGTDGKERRYRIEQVVNGKPLREGQKIKTDDVVRPVLGKGGFGITYLASRRIKDGNIDLGTVYYAIKEFFLDGSCYRNPGSTIMQYSPASAKSVKESLKDFKEEANRLKEICKGNLNIVNVNEVFEANGTAYYVMEFLEGESLRSLVKRTGPLSEGVALSFIRPIAEAVRYIHTQYRLLHLDIKPDNIMLRKSAGTDQMEPVLIDFGVSVHFNKKGQLTTTHTSTGISEGYSPQEQYGGIDKIIEDRKRAHADGFTSLPLIPCEVDVYALGATLYYILVGTNPYGAFSMNERIIIEKLPEAISENTRQTIVNAMQPMAINRTRTVSEFLKGFSDRYTLPKGYVIHSPNANYLITEIQDEAGYHIRYGATLYSGSSNQQDTNMTKKLQYVVYERFNKRMYKREKDESVSRVMILSSDGEAEKQGFLTICQRSVGMNEVGDSELENGIVVREVFNGNGTIYAVVKQGWKPVSPIMRYLHDVQEYLQQNIKKIGIFIAALILIGVAFFAVRYLVSLYNQEQAKIRQEKERMSAALSLAIEKKDSVWLLKFAEMDSARAFIPLARRYLEVKDTANALKFAKEAIDKGDEKGKVILDEIEPMSKIPLPIVSPLDGEKTDKEEKTNKKSDIKSEIADNSALVKEEKKVDTKEERKKAEQAEKKASQAEAARKALQYVNGERSYENHKKAYEWAMKADPATREKVIQRLKDMDFPIP